MDWLVHLLTNGEFLNFILLLALFGGFAFLGRGIKWMAKFISGHLLQRDRIRLEQEQERGKNLDKQLELEKLRQSPKMPSIITPDDLTHDSYTYEGYQMRQEQ